VIQCKSAVEYPVDRTLNPGSIPEVERMQATNRFWSDGAQQLLAVSHVLS
jgi:hypothetical protein